MENNSSQKIILGIAGLALLLVMGFVFSTGQSEKKDNIAKELGGPSPQTPAIVSPSAPTVNTETNTNQPIKNMQHRITLKTNLGEIQFTTYDADAPKAANNFVTLAEKGFYNNLIFHRVIEGFMIQGGDPKGTGTGGPGYDFEDELNPATESYKQGYVKGVVAMANAGPNTNGSQFFIMLADVALPHNYTIFGKVVKGQEIVDAIGKVATNSSDRPLEPVTMQSVSVEKLAQ